MKEIKKDSKVETQIPTKNGGLVHIIIFVFIDILGFSLLLPLLPYYASTFGANYKEIGFLISLNAIGQLLASPIIGRLSDVYGRKPLLISCVLATIVSFLMTGMASSLAILMLARLIDGLFGGNISLAQAYIAGYSSVLTFFFSP